MINMAARHRANKSAPALSKSNFGFDMPAIPPLFPSLKAMASSSLSR